MNLEGLLARVEQIQYNMAFYGREMVIAFAAIVFGLILIKWINKGISAIANADRIMEFKNVNIRSKNIL